MSCEDFFRFVSVKFFCCLWKVCFVFISSREIMIFSDESRSFIAVKILQWIDTMMIVLLPDLRGELNSTIIGVVYLSLTNCISVACVIILSRIYVLYGFGLVRLS